MQGPRRPWWSSVPLASGRLPTRGLLFLLVLLGLTLVAAALSTRGIRDAPSAVSAPPRQATTGGNYPDAPSAVSASSPQSATFGPSLYAPRSGAVTANTAYRLTIYTHCGLDWPLAVDFDGSFWDPTGDAGQGTDNPPPGFGNPMDHGVIMLVNRDTAIYHSQYGKVVQFHRHPGLRLAEPCL